MKPMINEILDIKKKIWDEKLKMKDDIGLKDRYSTLINKDMPKKIQDNFPVSKYKVWGSVGMGQYAEVPWVAIMDPQISTTTQEGFDIVFLFHPEGKGVYLSLNQGWKAIVENAKGNREYTAKELAISLSKRLAEKLDTNFTQGVFRYYEDNENDKNLGKNAIGYALGSIYYKYYSFIEIDKSNIESDLKQFIKLYKILTTKVSKDYYLEMLKTIEDYKFESDINEINMNNSLDIVDRPTFKNNRKKRTTSKRIKDNDLKSALKEKGITGDKGEELALQYFQDLIEKSGLSSDRKQQFQSSIKHVSKDGHGHGYDIKAFDPNNLNELNSMYIEVKATTSVNKHEPFFLSLNEIWAIKENPGKILIMRLYDIKNSPKAYFIDPYKNRESYNSIEEMLDMLFELEPISYKILGIKK